MILQVCGYFTLLLMSLLLKQEADKINVLLFNKITCFLIKFLLLYCSCFKLFMMSQIESGIENRTSEKNVVPMK